MTTDVIRILLVEDSTADARLIEELLAERLPDLVDERCRRPHPREVSADRAQVRALEGLVSAPHLRCAGASEVEVGRARRSRRLARGARGEVADEHLRRER